ncbi:MAG: 4-(cytidine 5'-diphospho)-2-C-methyl-D-erythritol kinase [Rubrivivax sp.]
MQGLYELPAPAKLNLFLHVVGRRDDGYHLLQSLFVLIDWCDMLHIERRSDGRLQRHDLGPALPADDLCLRAAHALQRASGTSFGADLSIDKRLPWGAGLGGGSSDAATTLLALNRLWGLDWPRARLLALAAPLGADVPFFVGGHNALVEGIGERLTPVELPTRVYAVLKPPATIETRAVFSDPGLRRDGRADILSGSLEDAQRLPDEALGLMDGYGRNDLQPVAERLCPEVAQAARWLEARHGNSRMTGSGSAVFARVASAGVSDHPSATGPAPETAPGWVGRTCRSLPRHPLWGWAD